MPPDSGVPSGGARDAFGPDRWDEALHGDQEAIGEVAAWLAADGLWLCDILARWVNDAVLGAAARRHPTPAPRGRRFTAEETQPLRAAIQHLLSLGATPAQLAAARVGNVEDGVWHVRKCGWVQGKDVHLGEDGLAAWGCCFMWDRELVPSADDPLLAPRRRYGPWDARAIRAFVRVNGRNGDASVGP